MHTYRCLKILVNLPSADRLVMASSLIHVTSCKGDEKRASRVERIMDICKLVPRYMRYAAIDANVSQISSTSSSLEDAFVFVVPLLLSVSILNQRLAYPHMKIGDGNTHS